MLQFVKCKGKVHILQQSSEGNVLNETSVEFWKQILKKSNDVMYHVLYAVLQHV